MFQCASVTAGGQSARSALDGLGGVLQYEYPEIGHDRNKERFLVFQRLEFMKYKTARQYIQPEEECL